MYAQKRVAKATKQTFELEAQNVGWHGEVAVGRCSIGINNAALLQNPLKQSVFTMALIYRVYSQFRCFLR